MNKEYYSKLCVGELYILYVIITTGKNQNI